jgi:hypothetical protein
MDDSKKTKHALRHVIIKRKPPIIRQRFIINGRLFISLLPLVQAAGNG